MNPRYWRRYYVGWWTHHVSQPLDVSWLDCRVVGYLPAAHGLIPATHSPVVVRLVYDRFCPTVTNTPHGTFSPTPHICRRLHCLHLLFPTFRTVDQLIRVYVDCDLPRCGYPVAVTTRCCWDYVVAPQQHALSPLDSIPQRWTLHRTFPVLHTGYVVVPSLFVVVYAFIHSGGRYAFPIPGVDWCYCC